MRSFFPNIIEFGVIKNPYQCLQITEYLIHFKKNLQTWPFCISLQKGCNSLHLFLIESVFALFVI